MRVASRTVASRCAMTKVVRPFITSSSASVTRASVTGSRALVASSRIRIGGSLSKARAMASRWRSPPESRRVAHVGVAGVRLADAQILGDRAVEQQRLLEHDADIVAQPGEREIADIDAIDFDKARLRIEHAVQERQR